MPSEIVVALCSLAGTLAGSIIGILGSNKMTMYRIEQLEKKIEKHNGVVERTAVVERDLKTAFNILDEIKKSIESIKQKIYTLGGK